MDPDAVDRIEAALLALVRRTTDARRHREVKRVAGIDVERSGAVLLARIEQLEPVWLSELAEAVGVDTSTASRQVARLVDDGLVERHPDPDDGRAVAHRLSPTGRDARARLGEARRAWLGRALADFDPSEREVFAELFERFVDHLDHRHPRPQG